MSSSSSSTSQIQHSNNSAVSRRSCSPLKPRFEYPNNGLYESDGRIGDAENTAKAISSGAYEIYNNVDDDEQEQRYRIPDADDSYRNPVNDGGYRIPANDDNERPPVALNENNVGDKRMNDDEASLALRQIMFGNLNDVSYQRFDQIDNDFDMHYLNNGPKKNNKNQLKGKLKWPFKKLYYGIKGLF